MKINKLIELLQKAEKEYPHSTVCLLDNDMNEFPVSTISYSEKQTIIYPEDEVFNDNQTS